MLGATVTINRLTCYHLLRAAFLCLCINTIIHARYTVAITSPIALLVTLAGCCAGHHVVPILAPDLGEVRQDE